MRRKAELAWSLLAGVLLLPFVPTTFENDPDLSWQVVLHNAFARHLHFGTDIVYTLGPFGFAYVGYDARTYGWTMAVWLLMSAAIVAGAAALLPRPVLLVPFAALLSIGYTNDVPFLILALLLARLSFAESKPAVRHLLAIALGLAGLVKFSFFIAAIGVIAFIAVNDMRRRRWPATTATFAASTFVFWLAARQPPGNLLLFLRRSFDIAGGYSEAMSLAFPWPSDRWFLVAFVVVALAFVLLLLATEREPLSAGAVAAALFIAFKAGFMRQDAHDLIPAIVLALAVSITFLERWPRTTSRLRLGWCLMLIAATTLLSFDLTERNHDGIVRSVATVVITRLGDALSVARHGTELLDRRYERLMSGLRAQLDSRPPGRSFDAYFSSTGVLDAWQLPASRRPAFQACCSATEQLLALNAEHLRGASAPDTLLVAIQPLDKRLPSMEESLSWREMLQRYEPAGENGSFVVLRRRAQRAKLQAAPHDGDLVFARIDLRYTAFGALAKFFFRTPAIYARIITDSDPPRRVRILPAAARTGFLLSPLVRSNADFERLFDARGRVSLPHVRAIVIEPEPFSRYFVQPAPIVLERMTLSP